MKNMGDSQFFAIQRLDDVMEALRKKRVPTTRIKWLDDARACIRVALGELDPPWKDTDRRAHLNVVSEIARLIDEESKEGDNNG